MESLIGIFLTGLIDPLIWMRSMSILSYRRSRKQCIGAFFICYILVVGKGYTAAYEGMETISMLFTIALAGYLFGATIFLFGGNVKEKVLYSIIFFCILFAIELIVVGFCLTIHIGTLDEIINNGMINLICSSVTKVLQAVICYWVFNKKKRGKFFEENREVIALMVVTCILVVYLILGKGQSQENRNVVLLLGISIILSQWYIMNSSFSFKKKDKSIIELNEEISYTKKQKDLLAEIEHFKHNFSFNVIMMKNLFFYQEYERFGKYMDEAFITVEKASLLYNHSNSAVRILISGLIKTAKQMKIPFTVRNLVKEFGMDDGEICSILKNLVMNGLEAAAKVPYGEGHVSLQMLLTEFGYEIRCINDCVGSVDFKKTTKQDKKNHGYGVVIVDKIVERNRGSIERTYTKKEQKDAGYVTVSIKIRLKENR
ncbi:MAG TPA: hypothetical protein DCW90_08965 [Lachnospiraceae bacterium]|nr:GHKL domain-containing protein [uncultured Lachnoclostridium sp.]HAU85616.1 hypothetical protein [Lachnospiraceae bacterium]